jgi:hypothetical protein
MRCVSRFRALPPYLSDGLEGTNTPDYLQNLTLLPLPPTPTYGGTGGGGGGDKLSSFGALFRLYGCHPPWRLSQQRFRVFRVGYQEWKSTARRQRQQRTDAGSSECSGSGLFIPDPAFEKFPVPYQDPVLIPNLSVFQYFRY